MKPQSLKYSLGPLQRKAKVILEGRTKLQESETWRGYVPECTAKRQGGGIREMQHQSHREQAQNTFNTMENRVTDAAG